MIKSIIIIYALIFMQVSGATCESVEHDVGPYILSIDAGRNVSWTLLDPMELELGGYNVTQYTLNGFIGDAPKGEDHVAITIAKIDPVPDPAMFKEFRTIENMTAGVKNSITLIGAKPISISPKIFDGYQGMIGVAYWDILRETLFVGQWVMNDTIITTTSNIRWGEGTQQIFDTIHINKSLD
jgi:hypothetical protein